MSRAHADGPLARRSFLSRMGAGLTAFGAAFGAAGAVAAQSAPAAPAPALSGAPAGGAWQPAKHGEDDWLDQTTAKHRIFYDTTTPSGAAEAVFFARNTFAANASGYKLTDADITQVVCLRHASTSFAFTDAMWAKYGAALSERAANFLDPKTKAVPTANVFMSADYGTTLPNNGVTIDAMAKRGVRFAVCTLGTRAAASLVAQKTGANADAVFKELTENLVPNARMVPAGIVAVNRAQERGYSFAYVA